VSAKTTTAKARCSNIESTYGVTFNDEQIKSLTTSPQTPSGSDDGTYQLFKTVENAAPETVIDSNEQPIVNSDGKVTTYKIRYVGGNAYLLKASESGERDKG
jgi:hypothetical protein